MNRNEECLWNLGNEVVRLRQVLTSGREKPDLCNFLSDLLELINKVRILGYSKSEKPSRHFCEKEEGYLNVSCFTSELCGPRTLWVSLQRRDDCKSQFSHGFEAKFCPICGFNPESQE